ncbi:hypothetical protein RFI_19564 [Reticulomyxa filosa]|uniref:Uncharacterized protein n=1 Tax=Reticulomyxa filosa TaxID=46433 RepID=X6MW95_RETFI|nr:hypothetical protein RFI_19564 [Reticulomyxa filosa]|eukprot:ETO17752.1 hypothetical protein RFI_19564 [Reticulomyxa filosa]
MLRNGGNVSTDKDWKKTDIFLTNSDLYGKWTKKQSSEQMKAYEEYLTNFDNKQLLVEPNALQLQDLINSRKENSLFDFEDHLDNVSNDWRNIHCC